MVIAENEEVGTKLLSGNILKPFGGHCREEDDQVLDESLQHSRGNNETDEIQVVQSGILKFESPGKFWVETNEKRYQPKVGDPIVGIIEQKLGMNGYLVNVNGRCAAFLPLLSIFAEQCIDNTPFKGR